MPPSSRLALKPVGLRTRRGGSHSQFLGTHRHQPAGVDGALLDPGPHFAVVGRLDGHLVR